MQEDLCTCFQTAEIFENLFSCSNVCCWSNHLSFNGQPLAIIIIIIIMQQYFSVLEDRDNQIWRSLCTFQLCDFIIPCCMQEDTEGVIQWSSDLFWNDSLPVLQTVVNHYILYKVWNVQPTIQSDRWIELPRSWESVVWTECRNGLHNSPLNFSIH